MRLVALDELLASLVTLAEPKRRLGPPPLAARHT
jgi:hypothetical protein